MSKTIENFKNEKFYPVDNIQEELHQITDSLTKNCELGIYMKINDFSKEANTKNAMDSFIAKIDKIPEFQKEKGYSGIYLFAKKEANSINYKYVGISKNFKERIKQHIVRYDKGSATWAFLMAKVKYNKDNNLSLNTITKNNFNSKNDLENAIQERQKYLIDSNYIVTFFPVYDNFLLYLAEPFIACKLKCYWNSFQTH